MPEYTVRCSVCDAQNNVYLPISEHGNWADCCGVRMHQVITAPATINSFGHVYEYKAVAAEADGSLPVITNKAQHQEYLKRNGYVEVGNEKPVSKPYQHPPSSREEVKKSLQQVMSR